MKNWKFSNAIMVLLAGRFKFDHTKEGRWNVVEVSTSCGDGGVDFGAGAGEVDEFERGGSVGGRNHFDDEARVVIGCGNGASAGRVATLGSTKEGVANGVEVVSGIVAQGVCDVISDEVSGEVPSGCISQAATDTSKDCSTEIREVTRSQSGSSSSENDSC